MRLIRFSVFTIILNAYCSSCLASTDYLARCQTILNDSQTFEVKVNMLSKPMKEMFEQQNSTMLFKELLISREGIIYAAAVRVSMIKTDPQASETIFISLLLDPDFSDKSHMALGMREVTRRCNSEKLLEMLEKSQDPQLINAAYAFLDSRKERIELFAMNMATRFIKKDAQGMDAEYSKKVIGLLGQVGTEQTISVITKHLSDVGTKAEPWLITAAIQALGKAKRQESENVLWFISRSADYDPSIRYEALIALSNILPSTEYGKIIIVFDTLDLNVLDENASSFKKRITVQLHNNASQPSN